MDGRATLRARDGSGGTSEGGRASRPVAALRPRPDVYALAPALTLLVLVGPVAAGLLGTLAPAFGFLPVLGGERLTLSPFAELAATPGIGASVRLSLVTGVLATAVSLGLTILIVAAFQETRAFTAVERALSPLLSVPHAAAAFGLAFLIAPSGWIARALSPWATGWERPPDLLTVQDPWGLALVAGLVVKEVPFLLLMTLAALANADAANARRVAMTLGYGPVTAWLKVVLPRIYPQIRLPVYAVLAYSMSVVDVAIVLGPTTPPPLSVRIVEWMRDPDLSLWYRAAAGAVLQTLMVAAAIGAWRLGEIAVARLGRASIESGRRGTADGLARLAAGAFAAIVAGSVAAGLAGLAVWSVAGLWTFPDVLPDQFTLRLWSREAPRLADPVVTTVVIAVLAAAIALAMTVACLEAEVRRGWRPGPRAMWLLYLPLIVPQTGFLFGLQLFATLSGIDRTILAVMLAHLVFVLPYVFLSLSGPFRAWDDRHGTVAASLGAGPDRILWRIRLPMLLAPVLTATAVGFAVSVGQYLPTLLIGAGRLETLTTEAVALAAGGDRRLIGIYALLQTLTPLPAFALALAIPAILFRRRRGARVGR